MRGDVKIGDGTVIRSGSYIVGPTVVGEGCEIGPHVTIFPGTSIGNNVVIYPYSDLRFSIIMNGVTIGPHAHISHSIVGTGTAIGPHFSSRHGKGIMEVEGVLHTINDAGVFVGDDCTIGDQVTTEPVVAIGHRSSVGPAAIVRKTLPPESFVM
jgi:glucose-1-phosphate thymidylyltransferase